VSDVVELGQELHGLGEETGEGYAQDSGCDEDDD